jgi:DNA mismatch repair protein MSH2
MALSVETKDHQKRVGVCYTDASSTRILGIAEFIDSDTFPNLESLLIQQNIKECILPIDIHSYESNQLQRIVQKCGIVTTNVDRSMYKSINIVQDLNRLLECEMDVCTLPEMNLKTAMGSTACIISYLELLDDESNVGSYRLEKFDLSMYMRLDTLAVTALNLNPGPKDGNKQMSLYGLLNCCKTTQGGRLLHQWIKQPLMNIADIETRQNLVELFVMDGSIRHTIQETSLKSFPDLFRLAKKFQRGTGNLQDVVRVYQTIRSLPLLLDTFQSYDGPFQSLLQQLFHEPVRVCCDLLEIQ